MRKTGILYGLKLDGFDLSAPIASERSIKVACSQCAAVVINGHPSHEPACPNKPNRCRECGTTVPKGQLCCEFLVEEEN